MITRRSLVGGATAVLASPHIVKAASSSKSVDIQVGPLAVAAPRGQQPLPQPYPLQSGFQAITSLQQITSAGNYQLMNDDPGIWTANNNCTLDVGGHTIAGALLAAKVVLKNANTGPKGISVAHSDCTVMNCLVDGKQTVPTLFVVESGCTNVLLKNNSVFNAANNCFQIKATTSSPATGIQMVNNLCINASDSFGVNGTGGVWDGIMFDNNEIIYSVACFGGLGSENFESHNCVYKNNIGSQSNYFFYLMLRGTLLAAGAVLAIFLAPRSVHSRRPRSVASRRAT